jgi:hypothetical protein
MHLGHLWFLADLLALVSLYAGVRLVAGARHPEPRPLRHGAILAFTLGLALATFVVRVRYPIDRWICVLGVLPVEMAHVVRDGSFFFLGVIAHRRDWLRTTSVRMGMAWLSVALAVAVLTFVLPLWSGGGFDVGSLRWSTCEAFLATGFCLGLPILFRQTVRGQSRLVRLALPETYGAYVVHPGPVIGLQRALADAPLGPLVKLAIVSVVAVPLSFLIAAALRRILRLVHAVAARGSYVQSGSSASGSPVCAQARAREPPQMAWNPHSPQRPRKSAARRRDTKSGAER